MVDVKIFVKITRYWVCDISIQPISDRIKEFTQ